MTSFAVFVSLVLCMSCWRNGCNAEAGKADIKILGISSCSDIAPNYELDMELRDEDDGKALYSTYSFPDDLSDDFKVDIHVDKKVGDIWEKDFIVTEGELCRYMQEYLGSAYIKAAQEAQPQMNEDCPITAGSFKLEHFQIDSDDVTLPAVTGHFMIEGKIYDPDEQLITCQKIELVIS